MSELNVGAANPRALAELVLGRRVNWKRVREPRRLLENALGVEYRWIFDPRHGAPNYLGLTLEPQRAPRRERPDPSAVQLGSRCDLQPASVHGREVAYDEQALRETLERLLAPPPQGTDEPWTPPGVIWVDPGDFFEEGTEFSDPVQGALGDCYLVAALSAVAWARPFVIAHRNRAVDPDHRRFLDMIPLYGDGEWQSVEVTEELPLTTSTNAWRYARSDKPGEIWPAVYEKAYAKWKSGTSTDRPDYNVIAGGDPAAAMQELTGLTPVTLACADASPADLFHFVRESCRGHRIFNPMTAWTYPTAEAAPERVDYGEAGLAAWHTFTVLGWHEAAGQRYIVLRDPWGWQGAEVTVADGTWLTQEADWWRPLAADNDGVFALQDETFRRYFGWIAAAR
jgi:hypothetical protein